MVDPMPSEAPLDGSPGMDFKCAIVSADDRTKLRIARSGGDAPDVAAAQVGDDAYLPIHDVKNRPPV